MTREQVGNLAIIQRGDPFQRNLIEKTKQAIEQAYQVMGFIDARVADNWVRVGEEPEVDLLLSIREGGSFSTGLVDVQGNYVTRDKVIRRLVRFQPGRPMDGREIKNTTTRLERSGLFRDPRVTPQAPDEEDKSARDVLVEIKEKQTGSVNFGVGAGTDSGLFGEISLKQQNFDLADYPRSADEFFGGRAFRMSSRKKKLPMGPSKRKMSFSLSAGLSGTPKTKSVNRPPGVWRICNSSGPSVSGAEAME